MRNILLEYPIIWNGNNYKKIAEVYIPKINIYDENLKEKAYNFISHLYNNRVPSYEESIIIEKWLWEDDKRIECKTIENCVKIIEECRNINNICIKLNKNNDNIWNWISDFLLFINEVYNEYLHKYSIIPNMDSEFEKLTNLESCKNVPENMIECLEKLSINNTKNLNTNKKCC